MSFATAQQMQDRSQGDIPSTHPFLQSELDAATAAIRNACGWHIATSQPGLVFSRRKRWPFAVFLPARHITAVTAATADGVDVLATLDFDPDTGATSIVGAKVAVTYTAGFDVVPPDLVTLCLELAAGGLGSTIPLLREQAGGVSLTYARTSGALTGADLDRLAPYRLARIV